MGLITYGAVLQNEVKAWPPIVQIGAGLDLVTQAQWFADVASPTTKATAVPSSGEAGLDAKFLQVIKCVTDAVNEGWKQRYTYADEPRVKSGAHVSALVWVATTAGGTGITAKLVNSDASETAGTSVATDGDWTLLCVEDHTCAGTYVELQVTKDATGTFYAGGPITVMVGADAIALPPRRLRQVHPAQSAAVKVLTALADEATWTDIDLTSTTSALAATAQLLLWINEAGSSTRFDFRARRNPSADTNAAPLAITEVAVNQQNTIVWQQILDDVQVFEYFLDRIAGATTLDFGEVYVISYEEWE